MTRRPWLVAVLLLALAGPASAGEPKRVLLLYQGPDGHPAQTHEYEAGVKILQRELQKTPGLEVTLAKADEPWRDGPALLKDADGVVLFLAEGAKWVSQDAARVEAFQDLARRKGGLAVLHWGMGARDAKYIDRFVRLFGGCHGGPDRKFQIVSAPVKVVDPDHPATRGLTDFKARDEFYYRLKVAKGITPLLQVAIDGKPETVAWAWDRPDGGRSFGFSGLHFHDNWHIPEYRRVVAQAVRWTVSQ